MPIYTFKLPDIGEGIAEGEIVAWHVAVGDMVEEDAPLADLMTDKATVEMTAPVTGRVTKLAGAVGDQIPVGSILALFEAETGAVAETETETETESETDAEADVETETSENAEADGKFTRAPGSAEKAAREMATQPPPEYFPETEPDRKPDPAGAPTARSTEHERIHASPAVRQRASTLGIDLSQVKPAEDGRIRHADLDAFLAYNARGGYRAPGGRRSDEQVRVIGMRRRIAENMAASKRAIPHFTYVEEIDVTKLEALRADLNDTRADRPRLTMLPMLIIAICRAVPDFPMINARYDDEAGLVTRFGAVHLGIATQTDAGLMVPVIRDAQDSNVWQLATEISRLTHAARLGKTNSAELSGSTLTVTSLGPLGGIVSTPVINRPEVAIIGPNKIAERPVFRDGGITSAKLMNMSISCDHRVVDGWDAASFVKAIKRLIETPALLFVD